MNDIATKLCASHACERFGIALPISEFYRDAQKSDGLSSYCKACAKEKEHARLELLPPAKLRERRLKANIKHLYGLEWNEYQLLIANGCEICGSHEGAKLCVDHNHQTGQVRGCLCSKCNYGLGYFKDNPQLLQKAISYLENHRTQ